MKKILASLLAASLAISATAVVSAATKDVTKIDGTKVFSLDKATCDNTSGTVTYGAPDTDVDKDFAADDTLKIWLNPEAFLQSGGADPYFTYKTDDGKKPLANAKVLGMTTSNLNQQKVTLRRSITKGSGLVKDVTLANDTLEWTNGNDSAKIKVSYIKVQFIEDFVYTKSQDIDMKITLYLDGSKGPEFQILGGTAIDSFPVDGDDYISLEGGQVADCEAYTKGIEVYLGNGVTITTNMFSNTKYYGIAKNDITAADSEVMDKHPDIANILTLKTINLSGTGSIVTFDIDDTYYVYNADGKYIGLSTDKLPYSSKYYLATKKIDMATAAEEEPADEPAASSEEPAIQNPAGGGDSTPATSNNNYNPSTGA